MYNRKCFVFNINYPLLSRPIFSKNFFNFYSFFIFASLHTGKISFLLYVLYCCVYIGEKIPKSSTYSDLVIAYIKICSQCHSYCPFMYVL